MIFTLLPEIEILLSGTWQKQVDGPTPSRFILKYELEYHPVPWGHSLVNGQAFPVPARVFTFNRVGDIRSALPSTNLLSSEFLYFQTGADDGNILKQALEKIPAVFPGDDDLLSLWQRIRDQYQKRDPGEGNIRAAALLMEFLFSAAENPWEMPVCPLPSRHQQSLFAAIRFMQQHLSENCPVEEIARQTGYSPSHFNTLFKSLTGRTPHAYYRALKLRKAKVMLLNGEKTVTQIASSLGFASASEFTRLFHRESGFTPRQFRAQHESGMPIYE
ncbi:MAG: helix-turn-helix transcriptional regulator [Clostridia bacterium]|nr:helix-turn-helix transcriptional regulator [Clostridia bacterium]